MSEWHPITSCRVIFIFFKHQRCFVFFFNGNIQVNHSDVHCPENKAVTESMKSLLSLHVSSAITQWGAT